MKPGGRASSGGRPTYLAQTKVMPASTTYPMTPIAAKAGICSTMRPWAGAAGLTTFIGALFELGFEADERFGAWTVLNLLRDGQRERPASPARQARETRPSAGRPGSPPGPRQDGI